MAPKKISDGGRTTLIHQINSYAVTSRRNKEKKLTLDCLQAQNYQLLGLVVAGPFKSSSKSGLIDKTAQNVVKDSLICPRSVKTVELNLFVLY